MSDPSSFDPSIESSRSAFDERMKTRDALIASARPVNKAALFDTLEKAGITRVIVDFDGAGDAGQIESVTAWAGETTVDLPPDEVLIFVIDPNGTGLESRPHSVREAIEALAYDLLEVTHCGWETGDGAFGIFTFDLASRSIQLEHNERVMETEYSEHVF